MTAATFARPFRGALNPITGDDTVKTGKTLPELAEELQRQSEAKRDFISDTRELTMMNGTELLISGQRVDDAHPEFGMRELAHDQIGRHLAIPSVYYDRLRREQPQLLDTNVNTLLHAAPARRMVRTLDGQVRAFLSDRYRRLDNDDLAQVILPVLGEIPDVQFPSCEVTDTRLYIKALAPRVQAEVKPGDIVQAGVIVKNSEVGLGSLSIEGLIFRLVCSNGMVSGDAVRRYHVGRQVEGDDAAYEIFADETMRADDRAFWLKIRDMTRAAVSESRFQTVVHRLRLSTDTPELANPTAGVTEIAKRFALTEAERESVLQHLIRGGDLTQYGAINAVTRAAQDVESYDRSVELETFGGAMLNTEPSWWRQLAAVPVSA